MKLNQRSRSARRAFTLIEMIVAIAIMAVLVGAAVPATEKIIAYKSRKATREELEFLAAASAEFFRDVERLPVSIEELIVDPGDAGWSGPYISGVVTDQISGLTGYQVDAWSRAYQVGVAADVLTIKSGGEDLSIGGEDIDVTLDVTWIRREKTLDDLRVINQAIALYNGQYQSQSPLTANWSASLDQLVAKGFLPARTGLEKDGWGDEFVADPAGKSPMVKATSKNLSGSSASSGGSGSGGKGKKDKKDKDDQGNQGQGGEKGKGGEKGQGNPGGKK